VSFPHGAYTYEIVDQTLGAGYMLMFTDRAEVSVLKGGLLVSPLVERINIDGRRVSPTGRFRPDLLAISLFTATRQQAGLKSRIGSNDCTSPVSLNLPVIARAYFRRNRTRFGEPFGLVSEKT
jgi:hypothetical protein